MARTAKHPTTRAAEEAPEKKSGRKPVKKATNLSLDPDAVARGERYGARHGRKLSQLVNGFLAALPAEEAGEGDRGLAELSPVVRRLYGAAAGGATDRDTYRAHLSAKYGSRGA